MLQNCNENKFRFKKEKKLEQFFVKKSQIIKLKK